MTDEDVRDAILLGTITGACVAIMILLALFTWVL